MKTVIITTVLVIPPTTIIAPVLDLIILIITAYLNRIDLFTIS